MTDTTDIEKRSLEAHVELCAERYRHLETKLQEVEDSVTEIKALVNQVHTLVRDSSDKRTEQLIGWGIAIIGILGAVVAWLAIKVLGL
jgi:hypothetical protein